jgi:predicted dehydrogenase
MTHTYVAAAGSLPKSQDRADTFAALFDIRNAYGSYEELAADNTVDIVYVGATNQLHYHIVMMMLKAGKHVLVEKVS